MSVKKTMLWVGAAAVIAAVAGAGYYLLSSAADQLAVPVGDDEHLEDTVVTVSDAPAIPADDTDQPQL